MPKADRSRKTWSNAQHDKSSYPSSRVRYGSFKSKGKSHKSNPGTTSDSGQLRLNEIKKGLRDLLRLLQHKTEMTAGEKLAKERELVALKSDLVQVLHKKARNDLISRYHHVRFFERRKAERMLKQAQKRAASAPANSADREELRDKVREAETNLNYTLFFPLEQKYVSLFQGKDQDGSEHGAGYKSTIWNEVEKMGQTELQRLRDRADALAPAKRSAEDILTKFGHSTDTVSQAQHGSNELARKQGSTSKTSRDKEEGNLSDGGFFDDS